MSNTKEIKNHINSVKDTQKITNAMYLIASTKMHKAKMSLDSTRPYFTALQTEVKRIFRVTGKIESKYFYPAGEHELKGTYGYLVITADKGLAGTYNQNVLKQTQKLLEQHNDNKLFVIGEYGRHFFKSRNIPIEQSFSFSAQNPTFGRAREIADILLEMFDNHELVKIFVIYTDLKSSMNEEAIVTRLLPFHRHDFINPEIEKEKPVHEPFEFFPSLENVLDNIVPNYVSGFIYSALIDSFCSEQSARMEAMNSANRNAQKLLDELSLKYNHIRQNVITQEITEVSAGAKAMRQNASKAQEAYKNNDR